MADQKVLIRHMHIPDVSIPDDDRSDGESRAVTWRIRDTANRAVVDVVTGDFSLHKDLAGQVTGEPATKFDLPRSMPYESAVLIGLLSEEGRVSVFRTTHGSREAARSSKKDAYALFHLASAGLATALHRGRDLDRSAPPETPYDMDQLPEPIFEEFDVTPEMLAAFDRDVQIGTIVLHEELSQGTPDHDDSARTKDVPPDIQKEKASALTSVKTFIQDHAVTGDVLSD